MLNLLRDVAIPQPPYSAFFLRAMYPFTRASSGPCNASARTTHTQCILILCYIYLYRREHIHLTLSLCCGIINMIIIYDEKYVGISMRR